MPDHEPEATPEQQAQVRRLLGEARHGGPVPPDVAGRLDGVLEQLVAEGPRAIDPPPPPRSAAVIDLGARRRRRVTGLLVAAAAVVVVGVGIGQVLDTTSSDDGSSGGSADSRDNAAEADRGGAADDAPNSAASPSVGPDAAPSEPAPADELPSISEGSFARDVRERQDDPGLVVAPGDMIEGKQLSLAESFMCPPTVWGPGKVVAVLYDSAPSVLVYRPVAGDTQTVELRQCGSGDVLRSTVLPAP